MVSASPSLVALDMDGTLIDGTGQIPDDFWDLLGRAQFAGMTIAPASGRQLATLRDMFSVTNTRPDTFIAENGSVVWHRGKIVSTSPMRRDIVLRILEALDKAPSGMHVVLCKPDYSCTAETMPPEVTAEVDKYYHANRHVASLIDEVDTQVVKIALFVESDAEKDGVPLVSGVAPDYTVAVSSKHWLDVMAPGVNKGVALMELAKVLGIKQEDTAAIGDYLNDFEMLQQAGLAVAMENAHPDLKAIADEVAESNIEHGALKKIREWLN
ncbi:HAD family hydrolase [Corynebacterium breve]|uniref:HAD family hydrolase n=1 Tax=Corynebacterium breve TaxID=3049799 RepID=A0ABY8VHA2_9CORY|nr:HAD family hydrolase [Corynebacterium breve]WIM68452.1 HAD family hydrolase [Corynebacterium breve]